MLRNATFHTLPSKEQSRVEEEHTERMVEYHLISHLIVT